MRRLSPEERALWGAVSGTVRPLLPSSSRRRPGPIATNFVGSGSVMGVNSVALESMGPGLRRDDRRANHPNQNTLDATWDKRLRTGQASPDFTIDLHGETLASAHIRLNQCLHIAIRSGARLILLITGRPARDNPRLPPTSRGVIRASVGDWLAASPHASHIAAVRNAHPRHGGAGAMYLILKRGR